MSYDVNKQIGCLFSPHCLPDTLFSGGGGGGGVHFLLFQDVRMSPLVAPWQLSSPPGTVTHKHSVHSVIRAESKVFIQTSEPDLSQLSPSFLESRRS